jgi:hypothetical protein
MNGERVPQSVDCRQPAEVGKCKKIDSFLKLPQKNVRIFMFLF